MAFRLGIFVLMLSLAAATMAKTAHSGDYLGVMAAGMEPAGHGILADALDFDEEMMMDSETARRQLRTNGYISYAALARNRVPCDQRGRSYYNCRGHERANPYNRGCTRATACARSTR